MAKRTVIVKVKKNRQPGKPTKFSWPSAWSAAADKYLVNPIAFEDTERLGSDIVERVLATVDESVFDDLIKDPCIDPIDEETANAFGKKWKPPISIIIDQAVVLSILRKVVRGDRLIQQEIDLIDENRSDVGVVIKKSFDINNYL